MGKISLNTIYLGCAIFITALLLILPLSTYATDFRSPEVKIFSTHPLSFERAFLGFAHNFQGGASIAVCNLDSNGYEEIVLGAGLGGGPQVRVFDAFGNPKFTPGFFAYEQNFKGGVNIACADLDGDGFSEIITAPKSDGASHIRIFNRYGKPIFTPGFFALDPAIKSGINIAVADIDAAGLPEIIIAPSAGVEPRVYAFNRFGEKLPTNIFPFHPEFTGGVSIASAEVNGGSDELVFAVQTGDVAWIKIVNVQQDYIIAEFKAFPDSFTRGVNVAAGDLDADGYDEIIVAANSGGGPHIKVFEANGRLKNDLFPYESEFRGGIFPAAGDIDKDGYGEILAVPGRKNGDGIVDKILVDLSEQRLWAFDNDELVNTFLVSTGLPGTPTLPGDFTISQKIFSKLYSGPDYYLPNTLWNMRFDGSRLLHGAYWHNNFGHRMSHGCVNISYPNAEWLYNATPIGARVFVQE
ncbi:MAG: L,D-transpeptidase family protein [Patescibacteria group bacterium]